MDIDKHEFQLDDLVERIKQNDLKLVALQVPEGLKMQALEMMDEIESETSARVVLSADPCYGACDLVHDKMQNIGVELVAHMAKCSKFAYDGLLLFSGILQGWA